MIVVFLAAAVAAADCPAAGRTIEGPIETAAPIYDLATQTQVGQVTIVKGQVTPTLKIESCAGRYFVSHLDGRLIAIPRKSVSYEGPISDSDAKALCVRDAGGASSDRIKAAGMNAADKLVCPDKAAGAKVGQ